jgi:hypothetical protein
LITIATAIVFSCGASCVRGAYRVVFAIESLKSDIDIRNGRIV